MFVESISIHANNYGVWDFGGLHEHIQSTYKSIFKS